MKTKISESEAKGLVLGLRALTAWGARSMDPWLCLELGRRVIPEPPFSIPEGEASLWVEGGAWRLERGHRILAGSDDSDSRKSAASKALNGERLRSVTFTAVCGDVTFGFGPSLKLRVFAAHPSGTVWHVMLRRGSFVRASASSIVLETTKAKSK